jgi:hypothetical protein
MLPCNLYDNETIFLELSCSREKENHNWILNRKNIRLEDTISLFSADIVFCLETVFFGELLDSYE